MTFQKTLKIFLVSCLLTIQASSQAIDLTDSNKVLPIRKGDAVKVLTGAYMAQYLQLQNGILLSQIDTLKARIVIKEMIVANLNGQITDYKSIVKSKDGIISTQADQRKILENNVAALNKELRKQRRGKKWAAFGGLLIAVTFSFLYITK